MSNEFPQTVLKPGEFYGKVIDKYSQNGIILSEFRHNRARKVPPHAHELAIFDLLLDGGYSETFNGKTSDLTRFTTVFHPANTIHSDEIGNSGIRMFCVELADPWTERLRELGIKVASSISSPAADISWLGVRLYREYIQGSPSPLAVEGLILEMLATTQPRKTFESRPPAWLRRVVDLLDSSFQQNLSHAEIAHAVNLHPVYVSRIFRQFYRQTIAEYLNRLRVQFASHQLSRYDMTLSEIAAEAGFADQSHFTRVFKQSTGLTPGTFRKGLSRSK